MIKIRVHIENDGGNMDNKVCVDIDLPSVPRKGEYLYIGSRKDDLINQVKSLSLKDIQCFYRGKRFVSTVD